MPLWFIRSYVREGGPMWWSRRCGDHGGQDLWRGEVVRPCTALTWSLTTQSAGQQKFSKDCVKHTIQIHGPIQGAHHVAQLNT